MTQQEIYQGMTKGELWKERPIAVNEMPYHTISVYDNNGTHIYDKRIHSDHLKTHTANAAAIVSAVNNTYGKGINPESVEGMKNALKKLRGIEVWIADRKMQEMFRSIVYQALAAAKL